MKNVPHSLPYKEELDGIRGIAILLVLFFHVWPQIFSFGFVGVDIFFVLSGYLITKIIITKISSGTFSFYIFYRNRIRRIFPAVIVVLFFNLVVGYLILLPDELKELGRHSIASALFFQNFQLLGEVGYWDISATLKPLLHYWSLSIEEQFYIIWPLLIVLFSYLGKLWLLIPVSLLLFVLSVWQFELDAAFYHPLSRFWELSIGASFVVIEKKCEKMHCFSATKSMIVIWVALILTVLLFYQVEDYNQWKMLLLNLSVGFLILSVSFNKDRILSNPVLVWFGLISFPLYLWHYSFIGLGNIVGFDVNNYGLVILVISVMAAWLTYMYIETYCRRAERKIVITFFVAGLILVSAAGSYIYDSDGLHDRPHLIGYKELSAQLKRTPRKDETCSKLIKNIDTSTPVFDYCRATSSNPSKRYVVIIGDSHAHAIYPGFSENINKSGKETLLMSNSGCPTYIGGERGKTLEIVEQCKSKIDQIVRVLGKIPYVDKIIISTRGPKYIEEKGFGAIDLYGGSKYRPYFANKTNYDPESQYFNSVRNTLTYLSDLNIPIAYVLENPELGFSPKSCFPRPFIDKGNECYIGYQEYNSRMGSYRDKIIKMAEEYNNVMIIDPESIVCRGDKCFAIIDGQLMYADDDHLSIHGSYVLAKANKKILEAE